MRITILAGGIGGSKFILGAAGIADAEITVIGNTGDDLELHGLRISPDLDTITYTLSGLVDRGKGWGRADETFHAMDALNQLGGESWFRLGDRDLAVHLLRTKMIREGARLSEVSQIIASRLGAHAKIIPATDADLRTEIKTPAGWLPFQTYFVKERCAPEILDVRYRGEGRATDEALAAIEGAEIVVFAPSNPIASIGPILAVDGIREALLKSGSRRIAVSPLVGGKSLKGPSDRMMKAMGFSADAAGVAHYYGALITGIVIDPVDESLRSELGGLDILVTDTVMKNDDDKLRLAEEVIKWSSL